jgi:hypothetical protein
LVPQGDGTEAQVTWEDQQNINRFGRLNNRLHELQDEIKLAKVGSLTSCFFFMYYLLVFTPSHLFRANWKRGRQS